MKTNKQVIDNLQEYYLKQDPKIVSRALANMMIDMNRIYNFGSLDDAQQESLRFRIEKNAEQLVNFIKQGCSENLNLINMEGMFQDD